jgi:hypothetical protein
MSKAEKKDASAKAPTYRIQPGTPWANAWKITAVLGVIGLAAALFGMTGDPKRFAFSWLFAFMTFLAVGLGGLFFVLGQHLTGAGWGVTSRRTAEILLSGLPVFAILFVPIAINIEHLYPWTHVEGHHGDAHGDGHGGGHSAVTLDSGRAQAQEPRGLHEVRPDEWETTPPDRIEGTPQADEHHHLLEEKSSYFHLFGHAGFFFARAAAYFLAWLILAYLFVGWSTRQDKEKGLEITKKLQRIAPVSTFVFGITLTFAAVDWVMSLEPTWYSTIYGVQYFAVSAVIGHATIILITLGLRRAGVLGDAINVEHYHDLGKLLFGFVVFQAYISFSQFMLIWYAGIPEEATYYHLRWWGGGGFKTISVLLVAASFAVPFFVLISRNAKRRLGLLAFACIWLAVMHVVHVYWLVMPYAEQTGLVETSLRVHWMDVASLFAVGGIYLSVVLWQMTRYPLVPVGDPRLARALKFENA